MNYKKKLSANYKEKKIFLDQYLYYIYVNCFKLKLYGYNFHNLKFLCFGPKLCIDFCFGSGHFKQQFGTIPKHFKYFTRI